MNISNFTVKRSILTTMVTLIVVLLGGVSLTKLPIDIMPDITSPTLSIMSSYQNAGPEEIEQLLTKPIEEAVASVPGVEEITSTSNEGNSRVRISFLWGTDLSEASNDLRERIDRIIQNLPEDAERPRILKFDLASSPIIILGAESNMDPINLRRYIDDQIKYRIEKVPGVAAIDIWGGVLREIHVDINKDKILALNLNLDQIIKQIKDENIQSPAGIMEKKDSEISVRTFGKFNNISELENTIISVKNGVPISLKEIAKVEDSWERSQRIIKINGKPGIRLAIRKQSGTNTVEVAKRVLKEIKSINLDSQQLKLTPLVDTSEYIQKSITNVGRAIIYGGVLTIFVLLFFLRSISSTFVIAISIPVSIVATFGLMYAGGFTINIMTLGGLALGVGMLVDNAIVVLENIYRLKERGLSNNEAAIKGSKEVISAITASTLTTLAIFLPLVFISGISGVMFQQLAYVIGFSITCSLIVAVTLVPMVSSKVLSKKTKVKTTPFSIAIMENIYQYILSLAMNFRKTTILIVLLMMIGSISLTGFVATEFMPSADESEVRVSAEMELGTKAEVVAENMKLLEGTIRKEVPELKSLLTDIGTSSWGSSGSHKGTLRVYLVSQSERSRSSVEIERHIRKVLPEIEGMKVRTRQGRGLFIFRMISGNNSDKIQIDIRGANFLTANNLAKKVKSTIEKVEGITEAEISREEGKPEEIVIIDRKKAESMGLTIEGISRQLRTILSGISAGNYSDLGKEYRILVKVEDSEKLSMEEILNMPVPNSKGELITLKNVVKIKTQISPVSIERKDRDRVVNVSADTLGRDLSLVLGDIRSELKEIQVPEGFNIVLSGDYEEQQKSFKELVTSIILALILVYMVMASLYESLLHPLVVMFSVPLAAIGVISILILTDTTFNVQTFIGCIMLGGIVVNNAIILVDQINLLREEDSMPLREAIEEAGKRRLRPILMTSITTIFGLLPLALGLGEGSEAQAPMARAVIGGMISSTLITLIIIPVLYYIFESWKNKLIGKKDNIKEGNIIEKQNFI